MKFGIAMMLMASLSAALLTIPSKVAMAQTSPEDQTMQGMSENQTKVAKALIALKITQIRSNHPVLAAIADKIQTMDAKETLKNLLGVEILGDLLKLHAKGLIKQQAIKLQVSDAIKSNHYAIIIITIPQSSFLFYGIDVLMHTTTKTIS